ncbi:MAG TPA: Ig-like domain-containing protein [Streptosporangiaceae bacterium]
MFDREQPGEPDAPREPQGAGQDSGSDSEEKNDGQAEPGSRSAPAGRPRGPGRFIAVAAAVAAVVAGGGIYALTRGGGGTTAASAQPAGHAAVAAAPSDAPLRVMSVTPAAGSKKVPGSGTPVTVTFSTEVAAGSPAPRLTPAVSGHWTVEGSSMTFTPSAPFPPSTRVTVRVPAGQAGVRSAAGRLLSRPAVTHFSTMPYSPLRLSQLLSQLGYLPLTWAPRSAAHIPGQAAGTAAGTAAQVALAEDPPAGTYTWKHGYPSLLHQQWQPDQANVIERGALMAFQSQHGMKIAGTATPKVWDALFAAAARGHRNYAGYTYAIASKSHPETLTIWHNGHRVLRTLANTGIPVAPTVDGTFPVYLRLRFQIMSGTNPDGSHYADPVSYVSYFNGGDAVHYFPRGAYGFQQSLGCVELPIDAAKRAYPYLTYGSLVTVAG